MAPRSTTNKAKAAGIGASSFLDLEAELTAKEKEITENEGSGKKTASGVLKPGRVSGLHYLLFGTAMLTRSPFLLSLGVETNAMEPT